MVKRKQKEYKLSDVNDREAGMLSEAIGMPVKSFYCWGTSWNKLHTLGLIDEDTRPTYFAQQFLVEYRKVTDDLR